MVLKIICFVGSLYVSMEIHTDKDVESAIGWKTTNLSI